MRVLDYLAGLFKPLTVDYTQLSGKPMTLDERFHAVGLLLRLRSRGDRPFWQWTSEVEGVLRQIKPEPSVLIQTLDSVTPKTSDSGRPSSTESLATETSTHEVLVQQIIDAAVSLLGNQSTSELGHTLREAVGSSVDTALWESGPVRMMKWLLPLLFAALVGGTIFGAYKVDGVVKLAEQTRQDIEQTYSSFQNKAMEAQLLLNKSYGDFQSTVSTAQSTLYQLRDGALSQITREINAEVDARRKILDQVFTDAQNASRNEVNQQRNKFNQALTDAQSAGLAQINKSISDKNSSLLAAIEKNSTEKTAAFKAKFADIDRATLEKIQANVTDFQQQITAKNQDAVDALSKFKSEVSSKGKGAEEDERALQSSLSAKATQAGQELLTFENGLSTKRAESEEQFRNLQSGLSAKRRQADQVLSTLQSYLSDKTKQADGHLDNFRLDLERLLGKAPERIETISARIDALEPVQRSMEQLVAAKDKLDSLLGRIDQSVSVNSFIWLLRVLTVSDFVAIGAIGLALGAVITSIGALRRARRIAGNVQPS